MTADSDAGRGLNEPMEHLRDTGKLVVGHAPCGAGKERAFRNLGGGEAVALVGGQSKIHQIRGRPGA